MVATTLEEAVAHWDEDALNVDKHGPVDEKPKQTNIDPIVAGVYYNKIDQYLKMPDEPFKMVDAANRGMFNNAYHASVAIQHGIQYADYNQDIFDASKSAFSQMMEENDFAQVKVGSTDIKIADDIRNYYNGRLTMAKLLGEYYTPYQQELSEYLGRNKPGLYKEREVGLLSTLPKAYLIDLALDQTANETKIWEDDSIETLMEKGSAYQGAILDLEFIRVTTTLGKFAYSYHFRDLKTGLFIEVMVPRSFVNKFMEMYFRNDNTIKAQLVSSKVFTSNGRSWIRAYQVDFDGNGQINSN